MRTQDQTIGHQPIEDVCIDKYKSTLYFIFSCCQCDSYSVEEKKNSLSACMLSLYLLKRMGSNYLVLWL